MLEAYFVSGSGEFVEELYVDCKSVYFDSGRGVWVCDHVFDISYGDVEIPFIRLPERYRLISVSIV